MELNSFFVSAAAGAICGVISGFGIGGGSILMVWMTAIAALDQITAQCINLLYFIPTAVGALVFHCKHKVLQKAAILPAALSGCILAFFAAVTANRVDTRLLEKLFGLFLCCVGVSEILIKPKL